MKTIKKAGAFLQCSLFYALLTGSLAVQATESYEVTNNANFGDGTLRDALASEATLIIINDQVANITIDSTLIYDKEMPLTIIGSGQTIHGDGFDLLEISEGADLTISDLDFNDSNNYDALNNPGGGKGISLIVPTDREGTVRLSLTNVTVTNVGHHGIHVSDCDLDPCGSGGGGAGYGSPASVSVYLNNVIVDRAGIGAFDSDGIRVDERSEGDIIFYSVDSSFTNVGADGVELDEGGEGDVDVDVNQNVFAFNGAFCAKIDLESPEIPECIDDDELDLDDAFDVDEAGSGSVMGTIKNSEFNNNYDEGLDFDEQDEGGFHLHLIKLSAKNNNDEGYKVSEEDEGDVMVHLQEVSAKNGNDDGIQIEEEDDGDLKVSVNSSEIKNNAKHGLKVEQSDNGSGKLKVTNTDFSGNKDENIDTNDGVTVL